MEGVEEEERYEEAESVVDESAMAEPVFEDDEDEGADQVASLRGAGAEWEIELPPSSPSGLSHQSGDSVSTEHLDDGDFIMEPVPITAPLWIRSPDPTPTAPLLGPRRPSRRSRVQQRNRLRTLFFRQSLRHSLHHLNPLSSNKDIAHQSHPPLPHPCRSHLRS